MMDDDTLMEVVIDLCSRTFLLLSDEGQERIVTCDNTEQFMRVLKVCTDKLEEDQIRYDSINIGE
jgi:imidazoleglycerol phosphate dehydratase HisB